MSSDIAIKVENLSKCYHIYDRPKDRLLQMLARGRKQYYREFWAVKDVSFEIKKGETVGIIGRNGSGKSTLLQMICGTLNPTSGTITTNGRIAALLELGSGFNPEFTGRENVYMNAAVLGLSRDEVDVHFEDITVFSGIGEFIDRPVKTYSSGMVVRLAFAVQSQVNPDILIVDEALSVGDAKFQSKCFERLRQLKENGTSILLVTHSSEQIVAHCSKAILLSSGVQLETGEPRHIVNRYMDLLFGKEKIRIKAEQEQEPDFSGDPADESIYQLSYKEDYFAKRNGYNPHEYRWGDGAVRILDFYLAADKDRYPLSVSSGQRILLAISVKFKMEVYRPILGITIKTKEGVIVYGINSETLDCSDFKKIVKQGSVIQAEATFLCNLAPGDYFISLGVATKHGEEIIPHDRRYDAIHMHVRSNNTFFGIANLNLDLSAQQVMT